MPFLARIFPKAEAFRDFSPPDGALPGTALPFIWIFVKALRWSIGLSVTAFVVSSVGMSLEPWFFGRLVDALSHADREQAWQAACWVAAGYILICQIASRLFGKLGQLADMRYRPVLVMIVRRRLATYLFTHSYRYFQDDFAGRLAGKVIEMPQAVHDAVANTSGNVLWALINGMTTIVLFENLGWRFALVAVCYFTANIILYRWRIPIVSRFAKQTAAANQLMRGRYMDAIANILIVKVFGRERHEDGLFSEAMVRAGSAWQEEQRQGGRLWGGQEIINGVGCVRSSV